MTGVVVPPPPAGLPPGPELAANLVLESGLSTPFLIHELPVTGEDLRMFRGLAGKLTQDEGRWLISTFLAFFQHGKRDVLGRAGIPPAVGPSGYPVG